MKRAIQLILIIIVAMMMTPHVAAADLKVIKLIHSDNAPAHIRGNIYMREKWLPKINSEIAKFGYKFDVTFYHSESLYKYADQVQALEDGLIDFATFVVSWEKTRAPLHTLIAALLWDLTPSRPSASGLNSRRPSRSSEPSFRSTKRYGI